MTKTVAVVRTVVLAAFWLVLLLGAYATAFDLLLGKVDWWMLLLPMWVVVTGLVTYSAWDDWKKTRGERKSPQ